MVMRGVTGGWVSLPSPPRTLWLKGNQGTFCPTDQPSSASPKWVGERPQFDISCTARGWKSVRRSGSFMSNGVDIEQWKVAAPHDHHAAGRPALLQTSYQMLSQAFPVDLMLAERRSKRHVSEPRQPTKSKSLKSRGYQFNPDFAASCS